MSRILVVEDEQHLADGLRYNLEAEQYDVDLVESGEEALERLTTEAGRYDLVILDVMLPGIDGFTVASRLRDARRFVPVLMLTARGRSEDVLRGFGAGADDYKSIDFEQLEVRVGDKRMPLTLMEAALLRYFVQHDGSPVPRKEILERVWGVHEDTDTRAIDNFIVRLRRYIEAEPSNPRHLQTVRGVGYRFVSKPE